MVCLRTVSRSVIGVRHDTIRRHQEFLSLCLRIGFILPTFRHAPQQGANFAWLHICLWSSMYVCGAMKMTPECFFIDTF